MERTFLDRQIERIAPAFYRRRLAARLEIEMMREARQAYDGATRGRRAAGWRAAGTDANAEISRGGARLRNVARDMVRNNPHAARAVQVISEGVVGAGITPNFAGVNPSDLKRLNELKARHLETTAVDAAGKHDLYGLQNLAVRSLVESGEVLIRLRWRDRRSGLPLPFQIEVLETDYLDTSKDGETSSGNVIVQGIEFDKKGRRLAYHLYARHPGGIFPFGADFESHRVPAEEIAHLYRVDRPAQIRGVTWFAPVILRMRDFADYSDAQLVRQKIAACFAVFIRNTGGMGTLAGKGKTDAGNPIESVEPGMIERLRDGEEVSFGVPPQVEGYSEYAVTTLHEIAVGLGVDYASLTGDNRQSNFANSRMGWLRFHRSIESWQWGTVVPSACAPIGRWFMIAAQIEMGKYLPGVQMKWTPPRREMFDPGKESNAAREAILAGLTSRSAEVRKLGYDPEEMDAEIAADNARADRLGLKFTSDGRLQAAPAIGPDAPANTEDEKQ